MPVPFERSPVLTRPQLRYLLRAQHRVISRDQLLRAGLTASYGRDRVRTGRWQLLHPGVYLTNSGSVSFLARCWAAVLWAGPGAHVAGRAAAYLNGTVPGQPEVIDIAVPHDRRVGPRPGVRIARRRHLEPDQQLPPRLSLPTTALDLAEAASDDDAVVGHIADAARQLGGLGPLRRERSDHTRLRRARLIDDLLAPGPEGVESPLEHRFHRGVVAAHGLPPFERQRREVVNGAAIRADAVSPYGTRCELDGRIHLARQAQDLWRDNAVAIATADTTLRYRWEHVVGRRCQVARQVADALRKGGWTGALTSCGPSCEAVRPRQR